MTGKNLYKTGELVDNRYAVLSILGKGGMGQVYKVNDTVCHRTVALKVLCEAHLSGQPALLQKEFAIMFQLRHPNLCRVYNFGFYQGRAYFTMEYFKGARIKTAAGPKTGQSLAARAIQILRALSYLHGRGIIHGDLKPGNIVCSPKGLKLIDFGLAGILSEDGQVVGGSLAYLAPEVVLSGVRNAKSDLYSLGVLLYELTAGRLPFRSRTLDDFLQVGRARPPAVDKTPPALKALILRLLSYDPAQRFDSAQEAIRSLRRRRLFETEAAARSYLHPLSSVGRERELRRLKAAINNIGAGSTHNMILVEGEDGLGKTRLLDDMTSWAETSGKLILRGACAKNNAAGEPYRSMLSRTGVPGPFIAQNNSIYKLANAIGKAIVNQTKKGRSVAIVMENIDLGNEETIETALLLSRKLLGQPVLIIASCSRIPVILTQAARIGAFYEVIRLKPLPRSAVSALLRQVLPAATAKLVNYIYYASGGKPFMIRTLINNLVDQGAVNLETGTADLEKPGTLDVPGSVDGMIAAAVGRLSGDCLNILGIGSLMKQGFAPGLLSHITGMPAGSIGKNLQLLCDKEILSCANGLYCFTHPLYRKHAGIKYPAQKKRLHYRIARYLEKAGDRNLHETAWQYIMAGNTVKGSAYGLESAGKTPDVNEAIEIYEHLLRLPSQNCRIQAKLLDRYGDALCRAGRYAESLRAYRRAEKSTKNRKDQGLLIRKQVKVLQNTGQYGKSLTAIEKAIGCHPPHSPEWIKAKSLLVRTFAMTGNHQKALDIMFDLKQPDNPEIENLIGISLFNLGRLKEALRHCLRATMNSRDPELIMDSINNAGMVYYQLGRVAKSLDCFKKCLRMAEKNGDPRRIISFHNNIGILLRALGQRAAALPHLENTCRVAFEMSDAEVAITALVNLSELRIETGLTEQAGSDIARAIRYARSTRHYQAVPDCMVLRGRIHHWQGFYEKAIADFKKAMAHAGRQGSQVKLMDASYHLSKTYLSLNLTAAAETEADKLAGLSEKTNSSLHGIYSLLLLSRVKKMDHDLTAALTIGSKAMAAAKAVGTEIYLAALINLAEHYLADNNIKQALPLTALADEGISECSDREIISRYLLLKARYELIAGELAASDRCLKHLLSAEAGPGPAEDYWQIQYLKGKALARQGRIGQAAGCFKKSIDAIERTASNLGAGLRKSYLAGERAECMQSIKEFIDNAAVR